MSQSDTVRDQSVDMAATNARRCYMSATLSSIVIAYVHCICELLRFAVAYHIRCGPFQF